MPTQNVFRGKHRRRHVRAHRGRRRVRPFARDSIRRRTAESRDTERPARDDVSFVKWIPVVVPLFAAMIIAMAYIIDAAVM